MAKGKKAPVAEQPPPGDLAHARGLPLGRRPEDDGPHPDVAVIAPPSPERVELPDDPRGDPRRVLVVFKDQGGGILKLQSPPTKSIGALCRIYRTQRELHEVPVRFHIEGTRVSDADKIWDLWDGEDVEDDEPVVHVDVVMEQFGG
jgi:hypothetical protein